MAWLSSFDCDNRLHLILDGNQNCAIWPIFVNHCKNVIFSLHRHERGCFVDGWILASSAYVIPPLAPLHFIDDSHCRYNPESAKVQIPHHSFCGDPVALHHTNWPFIHSEPASYECLSHLHPCPRLPPMNKASAEMEMGAGWIFPVAAGQAIAIKV